MVFDDKTLTCRDCGASFAFTAREQEFYAGKGFTNEPSRCPGCRSARKRSREEGGGGPGGGPGGGGSFERRPQRQLFTVTCSECGRNCEVPFQPRGDRPVYCSDCFSSRRGGSGGGSRSSRW